MITVSNDLKNELKKDSLVYKEFIIIENVEVEIKGRLFDDCYYDGHFIGSFIFKGLEFDTENDIDYKGKEFAYYKSIKVNGIWENIKIGTFIVQDIEDNDTTDTVSVVAYDYGLKTANIYKTELNYASGTVTLQDVSNELCDNLGFARVILEKNANFIVATDQFTNTNSLYGNVIKAIAQTQGCFAKIGNDDNLKYVLTNETDLIIEDYVELEDKRDTRPISCISMGTSYSEGNNVTLKDDELVTLYGENWLVINDNPFAYTQDKRANLIQDIFDKVKGVGYSSFVTDYAFMPFIECGDKVKIRNSQGNLIDSIVLRYESDFDDITLEAPSVISANVKYEMPLDAIDVANRAERVVDQQNQQIIDVVASQNEQSSQISQVTQDINRIENEIANISRFDRDINGYDSLILDRTVAGYGYILDLKIYGNSLWQYDYPQDDYPQDDYPIDNIPKLVVSDKPKEDFSGTYKLIELGIDEPLYSVLNGETLIRDDLFIDNETVTLTRRIRRLNDGTFEILSVPIVENLPTLNLPTYDGNTYLYILGIDDIYFEARYLLENDFSDVYATKQEVNTRVEIAQGEITQEVTEKITYVDGKVDTNSSKITQQAGLINLKVSANEVISSINISPEQIKILSSLLDIEGIVNFINNGATTTINGDRITTGTLNADDITTGTLKAGAISLRGVYLSPTSSTIGGFSVNSTGLSNAHFSVTTDGQFNLYPQVGNGGTYRLNNGARIDVSDGIVIASNSNGSATFPSGRGINILGNSGATVYMACRYGSSGTGSERSAVGCDESNLQLRAVGTISANGSQIGSSSSKATKKNIKKLSDLKKKELYDTIKNVKFKEYDYKKQYGKSKNYGFIIEEIEDTILNDVLHIVQNENDKNIKVYCSEDLTRVNLIMIQELMKKIETLENEIKKLKEAKK